MNKKLTEADDFIATITRSYWFYDVPQKRDSCQEIMQICFSRINPQV